MLRFAFVLAATVAGAATVSTPALACGAVYTVQSGDSLGRIAKRCDVSLSALKSANKAIRPDRLRVGQELDIPGGGPRVAPGAPVELSGHIVNGRRCAQLQTADGQRFGIVSSKIPFITGKQVTVRGKMIKNAGCRPDQTMHVTVMEDVAAN